MSIWVADNREVADWVARVCWWNGKNSELPPLLGDLVHMLSPLTLEPEPVHRLHRL